MTVYNRGDDTQSNAKGMLQFSMENILEHLGHLNDSKNSIEYKKIKKVPGWKSRNKSEYTLQ